MNEKKHLEQFALFYEEHDRMDELIIEREVELIKKLAKTFSNVLEIGCGNGYSTKEIIKLFDNYELLEASENNINLMKKTIQENFPIHKTLLEDFNSEKKWDNILFMNVLEHVHDPIQCLKKLKGIMRHEGLIYISVPNCMALNRRIGYKLGMLNDYSVLAPKDIRVGHRQLYTVDMLEHHVRQAGLKIVNMKGIYLKPFSEKQMLEFDEKIIKAFYEVGENIPEYCAVLFATATHEYY